MVQPKYSPEEALERVKLMMKYDLSKTLNENLGVKSNNTMVEQAKTPAKSNNLTDEDLLGKTGLLRQYFQSVSDFGALVGLPNLWDALGFNVANFFGNRRSGVKGVVDALDGYVDEKDLGYVLSVIKTLDGKCYYDEVDGTTVPAINRFIELYSEDEGGDDLISDVNGVGTRTLPTGTDKIKQKIVKEIESLRAKSCGGGTKTNDGKIRGKDSGVRNSPKKKTYKSYKPCAGAYSYGCKADAIKTVQSCLGLVPDGKFGPKTRATLKSKGFTSFTDAEISKICGKTQTPPTPTLPKDEFNVQVDADKVDDILNF